ncbi:hypothetical protein GGS24DRAFT_460975 [Hypoxylon argillaceum]|nr:hypothetical protein GGS24DRAFT_460975 [Hypoxylon argillaceum]
MRYQRSSNKLLSIYVLGGWSSTLCTLGTYLCITSIHNSHLITGVGSICLFIAEIYYGVSFYARIQENR